MATKTVFICSPFKPTGPDKAAELESNIALARRASKKAVLDGFVPICPHLFFPQFLNETNERELGIKAGMVLLEYSDELWVVGNRISEGMSREIAKAGEMGIPVKCVSDPLVAEEQLLNAVLNVKE